MTVNTTNITSGPYVGNGVTDQFSYTFRVDTKNQLSVYETTDAGIQTLLTVDTDYTVAGIGDDNGGTLTRVAGALPSGYTWYIRSNYQPTQLTAFTSQGAFFPDLHEDAMDKMTFLIQQILDGQERSFRLSDSIDIDATFVIDEDVDNRKGFYLGFDASGNLTVLPASADTGVVPQQQARQTGDGVTTEFNTPATSHELAISFLVFRDGVRQLPDVDYTTDGGNIGKLTFTAAPPSGADIDILFFEPNTINPGGFVEEAPVDGNQYARQNAGWSQVSSTPAAADVTYDNTTSGLTATDAQAAIDEVEGRVDTLESAGSGTSWTMSFTQTGELASGDIWMADASGGNVSRNLPTTPTDDDEVMVRDYTDSAATNTITIGRNGNNIEGLAEDLVIDIIGGWVRLKYDTTNGWRIVQSS